MSTLMSNEAVYRTAQATPGLLKTCFRLFRDQNNLAAKKCLMKVRHFGTITHFLLKILQGGRVSHGQEPSCNALFFGLTTFFFFLGERSFFLTRS